MDSFRVAYLEKPDSTVDIVQIIPQEDGDHRMTVVTTVDSLWDAQMYLSGVEFGLNQRVLERLKIASSWMSEVDH